MQKLIYLFRIACAAAGATQKLAVVQLLYLFKRDAVISQFDGGDTQISSHLGGG
jgi:hypothetical protein